MKNEFHDNFEVAEGVELEDELCKLGIVRLKYAQGHSLKMITQPKFIEDYFEQKYNTKAQWIFFDHILKQGFLHASDFVLGMTSCDLTIFFFNFFSNFLFATTYIFLFGI